MKVSSLIAFLFLFAFSAFTQINQEIEDVKHEQIILIDEVNKDGFMLGPYQEWFMQEYDPYQPEAEVLNQLKQKISKVPEFEILVFMSTWCSDSREQMPRFYKIIESFETKVEMKVYALDENKTCPSIDASAYNVEFVPTFIFYSKGEEIGRIIESPNESLEKDFLKIIESISN